MLGANIFTIVRSSWRDLMYGPLPLVTVFVLKPFFFQ